MPALPMLEGSHQQYAVEVVWFCNTAQGPEMRELIIDDGGPQTCSLVRRSSHIKTVDVNWALTASVMMAS